MSKEKAVLKWLNKLPIGHRELAIKNCIHPKFKAYGIANAIQYGVGVQYGPKYGLDFWKEVCKRYEIGTPQPSTKLVQSKYDNGKTKGVFVQLLNEKDNEIGFGLGKDEAEAICDLLRRNPLICTDIIPK